MDKKTLNVEELRLLKSYIESRGFREPLVVMEILDHFACLVEELCQQRPEMSVEEAMKQAHGSFGIMGFKTLADAAGAERNKHFKAGFTQHLKALFTNPITALIIVLSSVFCYKVYTWLLPFEITWLNGWFSASFIYLTIFVIAMLIIHRQLPGWRYSYSNTATGFMDSSYPGVIFLLMVINPHYPGNDIPVWPFALGHTLFTIYIIVHMIAQYRVIKDLLQRDKNSLNMYAELSS